MSLEVSSKVSAGGICPALPPGQRLGVHNGLTGCFSMLLHQDPLAP